MVKCKTIQSKVIPLVDRQKGFQFAESIQGDGVDKGNNYDVDSTPNARGLKLPNGAYARVPTTLHARATAPGKVNVFKLGFVGEEGDISMRYYWLERLDSCVVPEEDQTLASVNVWRGANVYRAV
ncbi:hypothetical protein CBS101457_005063 [Exobasidium rhododendri]|nr:hypothetical protein CBS101457_005063 [Exobasidium rhododendri]